MKRKIFIDVDCTIANLLAHYVSWHNELFGTNISVDYKDINEPRFIQLIAKMTGLPKEVEEQYHHTIFNSKDFWRTIPLFPNAATTIKLLNESHEIYLLTAPSFKSTYFFHDRLLWVAENLPFLEMKQVIFCENKALFLSDSILIDDYPINIQNWRGQTIRVNYVYNEQYKADREFAPYEWEKVPGLIEELSLK